MVHRKNIKHMHLYVKPPDGSVTISAPLSMSDESIELFVQTKLNWINKQITIIENQPHQSRLEYISGEMLFVWGKQYIIQTVYGSKNSLELSDDKAVLTIRKKSTSDQREKFVREWYRALLKVEIASLLPKWEKITGLKATSWQTKYMTTRWGTCNTQTGKIWISLQLAQKPTKCLEYVILHELIHLAENKHNKKFYSLMNKYMPMWKEVKMTLEGRSISSTK